MVKPLVFFGVVATVKIFREVFFSSAKHDLPKTRRLKQSKDEVTTLVVCCLLRMRQGSARYRFDD